MQFSLEPCCFHRVIFTGTILFSTVPKIGHIQARPNWASQAIAGRCPELMNTKGCRKRILISHNSAKSFFIFLHGMGAVKKKNLGDFVLGVLVEQQMEIKKTAIQSKQCLRGLRKDR